MRYESNECCDCAVPGYPCKSSSCSMRHVTRWRCDYCNEDDLTEDEMENDEICRNCYIKIEDES